MRRRVAVLDGWRSRSVQVLSDCWEGWLASMMIVEAFRTLEADGWMAMPTCCFTPPHLPTILGLERCYCRVSSGTSLCLEQHHTILNSRQRPYETIDANRPSRQPPALRTPPSPSPSPAPSDDHHPLTAHSSSELLVEAADGRTCDGGTATEER